MSQTRKRKRQDCLSRYAKKIDDALRFGDFKSNRTASGPIDERWGISRHSWHYLVLPALVAAITVMGVPECCGRLYASGITFIAVFFILVRLSKRSIARKWSVYADLLLQVGVVIAICALVWVIGGDTYRKGVLLYRNFFLLATVVISTTLILARCLSPWVWKKIRYRRTYQWALKKTELFLSRGETIIDPRAGGLLRAFLTVVPGAPLQLVLIPAMATLLAPRDLLYPFTIGAFIISYLILFLGGMDPRLNYSWRLLQQVFFRGLTMVVSLVIIVLAALRLWDVSYVSTVFDTAEGIVIAIILLDAYLLLWWYDYWINRLLAQELLKLLDPRNANDGKIPYAIDPGAAKTHVSIQGRTLQVHGASRFIVIGNSPKYSHPVFQAHGFLELFTRLALSAFPGGKVKLSPAHIKERIKDFKYLMVLVFLSIFIGTGLMIHYGRQAPQLEADGHGSPHVHLAQLLDEHTRQHKDRPALVVAASGGGTRAALYTAAVLEGLARQKRIKDVVMGSGVSGGGAALAYFAGQRDVLTTDHEKNGWEDYFRVMGQPFIRDVINGTLQWRIVMGSRLGVLLAESFKSRWQLESVLTLGQVEDFGLILNTAIAGCFQSTGLPPRSLSYRAIKKDTRTEKAGGRLILTNLVLGAEFAPSVEHIGGPKDLPVVVDDPETRLEVAAALNANFPPVFSNAAIDIDEKTRYWVTDGGAIDNRGIEMLLYALREAMTCRLAHSSKSLPAVTVVVADASAFSNQYKQDRGLGTMMSAGTQYASLLVAEQVLSIEKLYAQCNQSADFTYISLPMPLCLRESGSFGTHWMLQPNININIGSGKSRKIKGAEMIALLRAMHSSGKTDDLSPAARDVLAFARADQQWRRGAKALGIIEN